jgi:hypothetical protein
LTKDSGQAPLKILIFLIGLVRVKGVLSVHGSVNSPQVSTDNRE